MAPNQSFEYVSALWASNGPPLRCAPVRPLHVGARQRAAKVGCREGNMNYSKKVSEIWCHLEPDNTPHDYRGLVRYATLAASSRLNCPRSALCRPLMQGVMHTKYLR